MELNRRQLLSASASAVVLCGAAASHAITPEQFGARGDGSTNDTEAFEKMARFVSASGGGEINLRPVTYIVGREEQGKAKASGYSFFPAPIMNFVRCGGPLTIRGNGARLRASRGLRYGTFDAATGKETRHQMPYTSPGELAAPYRAMILVQGCSEAVEISDLELDGNSSELVVGGAYGDVGTQLPSTGIQLVDNSGPERLRRIRSHHHALDGVMIDGPSERNSRSQFEKVRCDHNGRQGCSIVGGRNYDFSDCKFSHTGKGLISSAPGAGVDIEAEGGKRVRDLSFLRCEFSDNSGAGLVADNGDSEGATFQDCSFIGTSNWAAWPNKPRFRFDRCVFVGPIVHAFGDRDPARATQFHGCTFKDDPALSPTGEVYGGENPSRPIADLPDNRNVLFDRCRFLLTNRAVLPWTTNVVTFANCTMSQHSLQTAYPRGTFIGRNVINGHVELYSARVRGQLIVNGRRVLQ